MDNRLLALIARNSGGKLLHLAVDRLFPDKSAKTGPKAEGARKAKRSIAGALAGAALTRVATRSVPGAIIVGGGILAKRLYDDRRARRAKAKDAGNGRS